MKTGQTAYEAYCACSNNKSLITGCELPEWKDLKPEIKIAWLASAQAVLESNFSKQFIIKTVQEAFNRGSLYAR